MDIEIEEDGFYPAHTRYTCELWMHMIEHCHHQQMRDAFDMDPTNVCWDENSMALAARVGAVEGLAVLHEVCNCPWDTDATYNALIHGKFDALVYLLMHDCPYDFTRDDVRDFIRRESLLVYEDERGEAEVDACMEIRRVAFLAMSAVEQK